MPTAFVQGFFTSAALIIAIGAQNAFVLRQGLSASMCWRSSRCARCPTCC